MNICFITGKFRPQLCGIGDYTFYIANTLGKMGKKVYIITTKDKKENYLQFIDYIKVLRIVKKWSFSDFINIIKNIKELKIDILNFQFAHFAYNKRGINLWIYLLPLYLRFFTRTKIVLTIHEPYIPLYASFKLLLLSLWQRFTLFLACTFSHKIVLVTQQWQRSLKVVGVFKKVALIPTGSNIRYKETFIKEDIKKKKGLNSNSIIIASFGTMHLSKNIHLILEALKELKKEIENFVFIWIGGNTKDEQLNNIKQEIKRCNLADKVLLTGFLNPEEIQEYFSIVDIFLAPFIDGVTTRRTSVITSMEFGLPIISTFSEFTEPVFIHKENIFLISHIVSPDKLKEAIKELIQNDLLRKKLSEGARRTFQNEFQWDIIASKLIKVYEEVYYK